MNLVLLVRSAIKIAIDGVVFSYLKKSRLQKSKVKTLLIVFYNNKGIIHKEFVPVRQTIYASFYQAVLNRLLQWIPRVRSEFHRTGKWILLIDNATAHSQIRVRQFLVQKMVAVIYHPPYCHDQAPGFPA